ncbi:MAG: hypothetical protein HZA29_04725 [Candidatus Omnitrophica bacterium]|nr:hypothetical protein [Candidatus Omnitrophota bacterium]
MKILVIHASAGAGHLKAAQAICEGLKKNTPHDVVLADALDYTSPLFKRFYRSGYNFMVSRAPWLWRFFFRLLNVEGIQPLARAFQRIFNRCSAGRLHAFLKKEDFDYVIATHFLAPEVAAALKRSGQIHSRLITVITDFDVHRIWLAEGTDIYAVACEWTKEKLKRLGVGGENIRVCGIPVFEEFFVPRPLGKGELKKKLGLEENMFTVLIATGSFGIGPIELLIEALRGFQTVVVCGHNRTLFARLSRKNDRSAKILGLVDNMPELMAVADVMVTKPGGLSIAEALASQLPVVFFNPIPGQETNNIRVLREHGIGCFPSDIGGIIRELETLRSSRDAYLTALKQTSRLARPSAVRDIISLIK